MTNNCYDKKFNNYDRYKKIEEFNNKVKYFKTQECCNNESCDNLAQEYQKLKNECNDIWADAELHDINEKGNIANKNTVCEYLSQQQNKFSDKFTGGKIKKSTKNRILKKRTFTRKSLKRRKNIKKRTIKKRKSIKRKSIKRKV